jgi:hypothetical protein
MQRPEGMCSLWVRVTQQYKELLEATFPARSLQRLYNEEQLMLGGYEDETEHLEVSDLHK